MSINERSSVKGVPAVSAINTADGDGVYGDGGTAGRGIVGVSVRHTLTEGNSIDATGLWGTSVNGEGIHGETQSMVMAVIAGYNRNPGSVGAAIYGEKYGLVGWAGAFVGNVDVTGTLFAANVPADLLTIIADLQRRVRNLEIGLQDVVNSLPNG